MRTFAQIPIKLWRDRLFRGLPDDAKLALLLIWSGPYSQSSGIMRLEDAFAAVALDWPVMRWQAAREALEARGLIRRDADTDEILIPGFFSVNRPSNDRARIAVAKQISIVESAMLQTEAVKAFEAVTPPPRQETSTRLQTAYMNGGSKR